MHMIYSKGKNDSFLPMVEKHPFFIFGYRGKNE